MCPCVTKRTDQLALLEFVHNFFRVAAAQPDDVFYGVFSGARQDGAYSGCVAERNEELAADGSLFAAVDF